MLPPMDHWRVCWSSWNSALTNSLTLRASLRSLAAPVARATAAFVAANASGVTTRIGAGTAGAGDGAALDPPPARAVAAVAPAGPSGAHSPCEATPSRGGFVPRPPGTEFAPNPGSGAGQDDNAKILGRTDAFGGTLPENPAFTETSISAFPN